MSISFSNSLLDLWGPNSMMNLKLGRTEIGMRYYNADLLNFLF
jgi:hypothetical protein